MTPTPLADAIRAAVDSLDAEGMHTAAARLDEVAHRVAAMERDEPTTDELLDAAWSARPTYCAAPDWSVSGCHPASHDPYDGRTRLNVRRYLTESGEVATGDDVGAAILAGRSERHPLDGTLWANYDDSREPLFVSGALVKFAGIGSYSDGTRKNYTQSYGEPWKPLHGDVM